MGKIECKKHTKIIQSIMWRQWDSNFRFLNTQSQYFYKRTCEAKEAKKPKIYEIAIQYGFSFINICKNGEMF